MKQAKFYYQDESAPKPNKPNHMGACAIIKYNDLFLMEYRQDSDYWALVGGGLNISESLDECILREILEETGMVLNLENLEFYKLYSDPTRIIEYPDGNIIRCIASAYIIELDKKPELICSEESREIRYFGVNELHDLCIVATHRHIIDDYIRDKKLI